MTEVPRHDVPLDGRSGFVGHKLEPEGVGRNVDFMTAHESFATKR